MRKSKTERGFVKKKKKKREKMENDMGEGMRKIAH